MTNPKLKILGAFAFFAFFFSFQIALAADIIIDDVDLGYSETGAIFSSASNTCGFNGDYRFETDVGSTEFAEWVPTLPAAGAYRVYVHYCVHSARPDAVVYRIVSDSGTTVVTVDQTKDANGNSVPDFTASGWRFIGLFEMTPSLGHKVELDTSDPGDTAADAVRFSPDIIVPDDYTTIQDAIDAAVPGATIDVNTGTYVEDLVIPSSKTNLILVGHTATIKGIQNVPIASFPLALPNIEILADGTILTGFTIEGPDYEAGKYSSGIVIGAEDVVISNNDFKVTPAATSDEISQAIQTYHKLAIPGVDISGLNIHDNTFTHLSSGAAGYEGIWINLDEGTGTAKVVDNEFTGNVFRAITTERSNTIIKENMIVTDLSPGVPGSGGWQGINVGGANAGPISSVSVIENTVKGASGFKYGIKLGYDVTSTFSDVLISENTIQDNEVGIWTKITAAGIDIMVNNIFGNSLLGVQNDDSSNTLNAQLNWWGSSSGPLDAAGTNEVPPCTDTPTTEKNADGTGDGASDNVDYCPWLIGQANPSDKTKPAVILFATSDPSPIKAGTVDFTVIFDDDMNIFVTPDAKLIGSNIPIPPKTGVGITNGWTDTRTWNGQLVITTTFPGDDEYDFRITKAEDIQGNKMRTFREKDLIIDTINPIITKTIATDIFGSQDLTVSASAYDPGSSGISKITVKIDGGSEQDMTFVFTEKQKISGKNVNVDTYYLTIDGTTITPDGTHTAEFKVIDGAGNFLSSSSVSFDKDSTAKTIGGDIAFLCKDFPVVINSETVCQNGIERQTILWLIGEGWNVEVKKYTDWTLSELSAKDLIVCTDQTKACKPTPAVSDAHKINNVPFVEISDRGSAVAADKFNYVKSSSSTTGKATMNLFVETPDPVTTGFFGSTEILLLPQKIRSLSQSKLSTSAIDLGTRDDSPKNSNWFKIDSSQRFAFVGWFNGKTSGKTFTFSGWGPADLNPTGEELLKRTLNWAQCGNPTGCL